MCVLVQGEDICDAAVREVKEETGVRQISQTWFIFSDEALIFSEMWMIYALSDRFEICRNTSIQVLTSISFSTGIKPKVWWTFISKVYIFCRQSHQSYFEKSDLFFVCMMEPLSEDIQPQESEIEAAQVFALEGSILNWFFFP